MGRAGELHCAKQYLSSISSTYLAAPASSAGVERVFSAAGKMHADLRKSMTDETLKHSLVAAYTAQSEAARSSRVATLALSCDVGDCC